jgi:hypothetical protein
MCCWSELGMISRFELTWHIKDIMMWIITHSRIIIPQSSCVAR